MILIVDAMNLFVRSFVVNPAMNAQGEHIGGAVGFLASLRLNIERFKPKKVIVIWEGGGSSRRRSIYPDYKSHRRPQKLNRFYSSDIPDTVENRNKQVSFLVEILKSMPVCQMYVPDCEADDVIGYLSKYEFSDSKKIILSSDKDFYQLLDNSTIIYSPTLKDLVTSKDVLRKFGITANNFGLAKSICGDTSDNIDGIKGAGFKTLSKRFPSLSSDEDVTIQDILDSAREKMNERKNSPKIFKRIVEGEDKIKRNWKLVYLDTSALSANQISQIKHSIDTFSPIRNKIKVIRMLLKEGVQDFNVDRMFFSMVCLENE